MTARSSPPAPDRFFASDPAQRRVARELYRSVAALPIVSPHGHTDPSWFATDDAWENATELFLAPDHYVFRMLYSQGMQRKQKPYDESIRVPFLLRYPKKLRRRQVDWLINAVLPVVMSCTKTSGVPLLSAGSGAVESLLPPAWKAICVPSPEMTPL